MYRIAKTFEIENGHMLAKHPDKCRFPHGHSRQVEIVVECTELDRSEMVCDFKALKQSMESFLKQYDHAMCMNTDDAKYAEFKAAYGERVIGFPSTDPTSEVMAKVFFDHCKIALLEWASDAVYPVRANVCVDRVRVSETSSTWAEY
jgi:6-pyruvoyltetrahydropterin/6-carboxytetrahydropterin synthase